MASHASSYQTPPTPVGAICDPDHPEPLEGPARTPPFALSLSKGLS